MYTFPIQRLRFWRLIHVSYFESICEITEILSRYWWNTCILWHQLIQTKCQSTGYGKVRSEVFTHWAGFCHRAPWQASAVIARLSAIIARWSVAVVDVAAKRTLAVWLRLVSSAGSAAVLGDGVEFVESVAAVAPEIHLTNRRAYTHSSQARLWQS